MTEARAEHLRLGCVKYLNAQPLIFGWPGPVVFDHPAVLCRQLAAGELDVALVSSFEYLRAPVYAIVDNVSVAADGAVYSVFVAHRAPIEKLTEILIDPASSTSVNLLRCLLAERGLEPRLSANSAQDGRLLIGDQALRFRAEHGNAFKYWDLAAEWKSSTGLPFVFALWLIRQEVADASAIAAKLRARRDANLLALDRMIAAQSDYSAEFCSFYFRECLHFDFDQSQKAGLLHFRSLCEKHSILAPNDSPLRLA